MQRKLLNGEQAPGASVGECWRTSYVLFPSPDTPPGRQMSIEYWEHPFRRPFTLAKGQLVAKIPHGCC